MATALGSILLAAGVMLSLVLLVMDVRISRRTEPYAGMNRISPEIHLLLALLSGAGAWVAWGWASGLAVVTGHAIVSMVIATKLR